MLVRIIPMNIWRRSLAESPKMVVGADIESVNL